MFACRILARLNQLGHTLASRQRHGAGMSIRPVELNFTRWPSKKRFVSTGESPPFINWPFEEAIYGWKKAGSDGKAVSIPFYDAPSGRTTTVTTAAFWSQIT